MVDYTLRGYSQGLGEALLANREKYSEQLKGKRVIEIGAGMGDLVPSLIELGVVDYCAVEMDGVGLDILCGKIAHWNDRENAMREFRHGGFVAKYVEAQKKAIDALVEEARTKEVNPHLDADELLGKHFLREAERIYEQGVMFEVYTRKLTIDGIERRFSCYYSPDLRQFLQAQPDESAVVMSAGVLSIAFRSPINGKLPIHDYLREFRKYKDSVYAEILRITPTGGATIHAETDGSTMFFFGLQFAGFQPIDVIRQQAIIFGSPETLTAVILRKKAKL